MKTKIRALLVLLTAAMILLLSGCGGGYTCNVTFGSSTCNSSGSGIGSGTGTGGGGGGGSTTINASNATALVYYLNGTGIAGAGLGGTTFAPLSSYTAPPLSSALADNMAIVNKQFVYVPMGDSTIQAYSITRSTGALAAIAGSPFTVSGLGTADGAWADPQGRFLFVGSEAQGNIWVFQINSSTGVLTEVSGSPFTSINLVSADIMTVDASGKFLYVGQLQPASGVEAFSINQITGALTEVAGSPFLLNVAQLHANPAAEFLLGVAQIQDQGSVSGATDPHIYVFSINTTTGVPTAVTGSPFLTSAAPFDFAVSPNGKFVYSVGTQIATTTIAPLEGYQMDTTTGALTLVSGSPFTTLPLVSECQFEQAGANLFCVDKLLGGSTIYAFAASSSNGSMASDASLSATAAAFAVTD
jgi:6-phosphogluconolactonase (cycloisomerase 2 family)